MNREYKLLSYLIRIDLETFMNCANYMINGKDYTDILNVIVAVINEYEKEVKDKYLLTYLALSVNSEDIKNILTNAVININDGSYIYNFAVNVYNIDINKLSMGIANTMDKEYMFKFARDVKNANLDIIIPSVIATNDLEYVMLFSKNNKLNCFQKNELLDRIIKVNNLKERKLLNK